MKVFAQVQGISKVLSALDKAGEVRKAKVDRVLSKTGLNVVSYARKGMRASPATGITYQKSASVRHTASSPGAFPRIDTGTLANSVKMVKGKNEVFVGTNKDYGRFLEFGTVNMDARPWLFPSLEANNKQFQSDMREALK
jgi:HK97 gp10 family phage protein